MRKLVFLHSSLLDIKSGSTEKLLRNLIRLSVSLNCYKVYLIYESNPNVEISNEFDNDPKISLLDLSFFYVPSNIESKKELFKKILNDISPDILVTVVNEPCQDMIRNIPRWIPVILISPFGYFSSNGNIRRLYVSGKKNVQILKKFDVKNAESFCNPFIIPSLNNAKAEARNFSKNQTIVFGRSGRSDAFVFDPISIKAFAMLENKFGSIVKYIYLNPSKEAVLLASSLGIKNIEFKGWQSEEDLTSFYREIDVFAHSRRDGETLGVAIIEAMLYQNPVISHESLFFNEHLQFVNEDFMVASKLDDALGYFNWMSYYVDNIGRIGEIGLKARNAAIDYISAHDLTDRFLKDLEEVSNYVNSPGGIISFKYFVYFQMKMVLKKIRNLLLST